MYYKADCMQHKIYAVCTEANKLEGTGRTYRATHKRTYGEIYYIRYTVLNAKSNSH